MLAPGKEHTSALAGVSDGGPAAGNAATPPATMALSPAPAPPVPAAETRAPTVWGLDPIQLHDRFWAQRGVQVVRPGDPQPLSDRAQLFLLTQTNTLAILESSRQFETLYWSSPELVVLKVSDSRDRAPQERIVTDGDNNFVRFERIYDRPEPRSARAALTPSREVARRWQQTDGANHDGWRKLRRSVPRRRRSTLIIGGSLYDRASEADLARAVKDLTRLWAAGPGAVVPRAREIAPRVWADQGVDIDPAARFVAPVWIGAGRRVDPQTTLIGPLVLWDDPAARPQPEPVAWPDIIRPNLPELRRPLDSATQHAKRMQRLFKRAFDLAFALVALVFTLPLYPFIMLAIWLEDGWPVFFAHRRETVGGRDFPCFKFRSMYRDAEKIKQKLQADGQNQADGPQFFMEEDVRVTKVGKFLRKTRLDELPQFFNVLLGHMSVVGPRPSPFKENQCCPAWREARLSVRPGITGLWQIKRKRKKGEDFQEWIKYDIEYVENISFSLDMIIIARTILVLLAGLIPFRRKAE